MTLGQYSPFGQQYRGKPQAKSCTIGQLQRCGAEPAARPVVAAGCDKRSYGGEIRAVTLYKVDPRPD